MRLFDHQGSWPPLSVLLRTCRLSAPDVVHIAGFPGQSAPSELVYTTVSCIYHTYLGRYLNFLATYIPG